MREMNESTLWTIGYPNGSSLAREGVKSKPQLIKVYHKCWKCLQQEYNMTKLLCKSEVGCSDFRTIIYVLCSSSFYWSWFRESIDTGSTFPWPTYKSSRTLASFAVKDIQLFWILITSIYICFWINFELISKSKHQIPAILIHVIKQKWWFT